MAKLNTPSRKYCPYFTDTLGLIRKRKIQALKRYHRTKCESHKLYYIEIRNVFKQALVSEKKAYYRHLFNNNSNCKRLWTDLKKMGVIKRTRPEISSSLGDAKTINEYFISQIPQTTISDELIAYYNWTVPPGHLLKFKPLDENTFYHILKRITSNSAGIDGITLHMIQLLFPIGLHAFLNIVNCSLEQGVFPDIWKTAIITPIPKKSPVQSLDDIRPISILSLLSKILEKHIHNQIVDYLDGINFLPVLQSGFRVGHSTQTALLKVINDICASWDKYKLTCLVLLDYSKAFDTLSHKLLIAILHSSGIRGTALDLFKSYVLDRKQAVKFNSQLSEPLHIKCGVPQGSILGPLLFTLYVASIGTALTHMNFHQYADDLQLYMEFTVNNYQEAFQCVNTDLEEVCKWSADHGLFLNSGKSKVLIIGPKVLRNKLNVNNVKVFVNGSNIELVPHARNLGVVLDNDLNFSQHISIKIRSAFVILKYLYVLKWYLPTDIKIKLTEVLVMNSVAYGLNVYGHLLTKDLMSRLQYIQNSCIRYAYNVNRREHITPYLAKAETLNIKQRCVYSMSVLLFKILKSKSPIYLFRHLQFYNDIHCFNTRNRDTIIIPLHRSDKYKGSFSYMAAYIYNRYKYLFLQTSTVSTFKNKFKLALLNEN
jgi:hypothetical protein